MHDSDKKIFELLDILIQFKIIKYKIQFWRIIDYKMQNLVNVKKGITHFTIPQIVKIAQYYNVNYNWIFGTDKLTFNNNDLPIPEYGKRQFNGYVKKEIVY